MKIGDFDVEVSSIRVGGGWQSSGILPDGKKIISGPKSSREDAEHDVEQQAKARLYPQRRYDVNRPFESMNIDERQAKLGSGKRFAKLERKLSHQKGIRDPGAVAAAHGRKTLGKERFQKLAAAGRRRHSESVEQKYPDLSPADEAIVMHQADRLLEEVIPLPSVHEIDPESGGMVRRPECPNCGTQGEPRGNGTYDCPGCGTKFSADISQFGTGRSAVSRPKGAFYPSDGGSAGGGGGITSA